MRRIFGMAVSCLAWSCFGWVCLAGPRAFAQDPQNVDTQATLSVPSVDERWDFFLQESISPLTFTGAGIEGTLSQLTRSAPLYGKHFWRHDAFLKRIGANLGDDTSQNFFSDFLMASALHEDTRYRKEGKSHSVGHRIGYAISRAIVTRTDTGDATFNWANLIGCGMSAGLSNAYYPPISRTPSVTFVNWGTNVASAGLSNLAPEFASDVGHWFKRRLGFHR